MEDLKESLISAITQPNASFIQQAFRNTPPEPRLRPSTDLSNIPTSLGNRMTKRSFPACRDEGEFLEQEKKSPQNPPRLNFPRSRVIASRSILGRCGVAPEDKCWSARVRHCPERWKKGWPITQYCCDLCTIDASIACCLSAGLIFFVQHSSQFGQRLFRLQAVSIVKCFENQNTYTIFDHDYMLVDFEHFFL